MCNVISVIVVKDGAKTVVLPHATNKKNHSHTSILSSHKLDFLDLEGTLSKRKLVRIEIRPKESIACTIDELRNEGIPVKNWKLRVDETGTLPNWFKTNRKTIEASVRKVAEAIMDPKYKPPGVYKMSPPKPEYTITSNEISKSKTLTTDVMVEPNKKVLTNICVTSDGEWAIIYAVNALSTIDSTIYLNRVGLRSEGFKKPSSGLFRSSWGFLIPMPKARCPESTSF